MDTRKITTLEVRSTVGAITPRGIDKIIVEAARKIMEGGVVLRTRDGKRHVINDLKDYRRYIKAAPISEPMVKQRKIG